MLKNHILHLLQKDRTPRTLSHLEQELGIHDGLRRVFREAVDSLAAEGSVIVGPRDRVRLASMSNEVTGVFRANPRGFGFVTPQQITAEGDLYIPAKSTGSAMTGDRVVARVVRAAGRDDDRFTGEVVRVLERAHGTVAGTVRQEPSGWFVEPDGGDFTRPVQIEGIHGGRIHHGDKVAVDIRVFPTRAQPARGVITAVLGRPGRFATETAAVIRRHDLPDEFDDSSLVEASNARAAFNPQDTRGREDLTDALVVTIDPPDAKDFDDAISLTPSRQGGWVLGVHIADVSHFVAEGSALDQAACDRGNSVYLPGRVLPMLPEMLSNGVCSLQPGQPRYTKSVFLTYSKDGRVLSTRFANTVIKSSARLSYQQVDRILKDARGGRAGSMPSPDRGQGISQDVVSLLQEMETLARCIEDRRRQAGMLQLKMPETEVVTDTSGRPIAVQPADAGYPHTIIEMFMVEANVAVATLLDRQCVPFMRRIHPEPNANALRQLAQTLRLLGVRLSRRPHRSDLQALLDRMRGSRMELPVSILLLRSLARAAYSPTSVGHYALAASKYCHFTSPIRRYADLMVHRALQDYLTGNLDRARRRYVFPDLVEIGEHLTETELIADDAEQELKTILVLHLLRDRVGEEMKGVVVNLTSFGVSVHLPDFGVEGLVRPEALGPDRWQLDEQNQCLIGRHTGAMVRLAQRMRVRIADVHPAAGQLDLEPAMILIGKAPAQTSERKPRRRRSRNRPRSRKKR